MKINWSLLFLFTGFLVWFSGIRMDQHVTDSRDQHHMQTEEEISFDYCQGSNNTFQNGEELTYKIYYNINFIWIGAGTATFKIKRIGDKFHAEAVGVTYPSYDWIYKVRDTFQSVIDSRTLLPYQSVRIVNEGNYTRYDQVNYFRQTQKAESKMGKTIESADLKTIPISECVHDILSMMYAMRNTPLESLETKNSFAIEMLLDRKKYPITLRYKGKENQKKIKGLGSIDTYLFEPSLIAGNIFSDDKGMKIWVSRDRNKIPLLVESPVSVGKVKAVLIEHKKLRYETSGY